MRTRMSHTRGKLSQLLKNVTSVNKVILADELTTSLKNLIV